MITREIAQDAGIVITTTDFDRLQNVLESSRFGPAVGGVALREGLRAARWSPPGESRTALSP